MAHPGFTRPRVSDTALFQGIPPQPPAFWDALAGDFVFSQHTFAEFGRALQRAATELRVVVVVRNPSWDVRVGFSDEPAHISVGGPFVTLPLAHCTSVWYLSRDDFGRVLLHVVFRGRFAHTQIPSAFWRVLACCTQPIERIHDPIAGADVAYRALPDGGAAANGASPPPQWVHTFCFLVFKHYCQMCERPREQHRGLWALWVSQLYDPHEVASPAAAPHLPVAALMERRDTKQALHVLTWLAQVTRDFVQLVAQNTPPKFHGDATKFDVQDVHGELLYSPLARDYLVAARRLGEAVCRSDGVSVRLLPARPGTDVDVQNALLRSFQFRELDLVRRATDVTLWTVVPGAGKTAWAQSALARVETLLPPNARQRLVPVFEYHRDQPTLWIGWATPTQSTAYRLAALLRLVAQSACPGNALPLAPLVARALWAAAHESEVVVLLGSFQLLFDRTESSYDTLLTRVRLLARLLGTTDLAPNARVYRLLFCWESCHFLSYRGVQALVATCARNDIKSTELNQLLKKQKSRPELKYMKEGEKKLVPDAFEEEIQWMPVERNCAGKVLEWILTAIGVHDAEEFLASSWRCEPHGNPPAPQLDHGTGDARVHAVVGQPDDRAVAAVRRLVAAEPQALTALAPLLQRLLAPAHRLNAAALPVFGKVAKALGERVFAAWASEQSSGPTAVPVPEREALSFLTALAHGDPTMRSRVVPLLQQHWEPIATPPPLAFAADALGATATQRPLASLFSSPHKPHAPASWIAADTADAHLLDVLVALETHARGERCRWDNLTAQLWRALADLPVARVDGRFVSLTNTLPMSVDDNTDPLFGPFFRETLRAPVAPDKFNARQRHALGLGSVEELVEGARAQ